MVDSGGLAERNGNPVLINSFTLGKGQPTFNLNTLAHN